MKRMFLLFVVLLAGLVVSQLAALFSGQYENVEAVAGVVEIPVESVNNGSAHYFSLAAADKEIKFFVLKSSDGVLRAAFDACDVCYLEKLGYSQDGEFMVCNNCGQRFHSKRINVEKGGCNPAPLGRKVSGEKLLITKADILSGAWYF